MVQALLLNFCVLITLTYLLSLTYRTWPDPRSSRWTMLRLGLESLVPLALLLSPAMIVPGVLVDLRVVPLALTTLRFGPKIGLFIMVPTLIYRTYLGGAGVLSGYVSVLGVILIASVFRRRANINDPHFSWFKNWGWLIFIFVPNALLLPLVTHSLKLFFSVYLPLLFLDIVGFLVAHSVLLSRFRLLQLTSKLWVQANHDDLTGLANRRQFDTDLSGLQPYDAVLLLDIDHFKRVNDDYGHLVGDTALSRVGQTLLNSLRGTDRAYRYGGEEFAVILKNFDLNGASYSLGTAERLRQKLAAIPMPELAQRHITVSIGVAEMTNATDAQDALKKADAALYQAKRSGRNQVQLWNAQTVEAEPT